MEKRHTADEGRKKDKSRVVALNIKVARLTKTACRPEKGGVEKGAPRLMVY